MRQKLHHTPAKDKQMCHIKPVGVHFTFWVSPVGEVILQNFGLLD
jgi:hypothetical protein